MLYYSYAIEIVKTSKQAQTRALAVAHGRTGKLTIGVFGGLQIHGLRDIVTFCRENPEVDLQLRLVSSLEQYEELKQGAFDIVFSSVAFLSRFDDVTCVNPITSRICAVVSRNHPLAKRRVISERELGGFTAIVTERFQYEMVNGLATYPEADVFGNIRTCENFDMIWLFTRLNMGVALFPSYTKPSLQSDLVMIQIKEEGWHLTEAWCSLTGNTNPVLQSFIEYLEKEGT
jgi:DNA-binding transcriptional LysR family regulator